MANYLGTTTDNNDNNIMMKTKLKFFFVFLAMIVGTNCVWADETVGNSDNSTQKSNNWYSTEYTLTSSQKLHLDFTNYTKGMQTIITGCFSYQTLQRVR